MQRLRTSGTSIFGSLALPCLKKKARNSWSAVQDTYFSTKDVFERHRVVFTVSTSIASVVTAWAGYSLRYHHQSKVEERLSSIEKVVPFRHIRICQRRGRCISLSEMTSNHHVEHEEIKKIVNSGNVSSAACVATAGATLILGYGLGWRGGKWNANRKFRKEQMKLLGQIKPSRWEALQRRLARSRTSDSAHRTPEVLQGVDTAQFGSQQAHQS